MTEKLLTFASPTPPSATSRDPGDGVNRSKVNYFPEQHQHKPIKSYTGTCAVPGFFSSGGGGGGPGSSTYFTVHIQRRSNGYFTHFQGVPTFSRVGGSKC